MSGLHPDQVQKIHEYIHNQQLIHAIKLYREATGTSLAEAKAAVEAMARGEAVKPPSGTRDYDNPILEGRLKSLLTHGRKVDAVNIYREEYGVSLKQAKDAVDRIEASMKRGAGLSANMPAESAFGKDPFADDDRVRGRGTVLMAAVIALLVLGLAVFFLMMEF